MTKDANDRLLVMPLAEGCVGFVDAGGQAFFNNLILSI